MDPNHARGNYLERSVAKALGGKRMGYKGYACSDIDGVPWSVECTRTKDIQRAMRRKWEQAVRNAKKEGQEPVVVIAGPRQPLRDAFTGLRFSLFQKLTQTQKHLIEFSGILVEVEVRGELLDWSARFAEKEEYDDVVSEGGGGHESWDRHP